MVRDITRLQLRVKFVRRFEECGMKRSSVTFEAMPQSRERAVRFRPFTKVSKNLLAGLVSMQRLQLGPFLGLRLTDFDGRRPQARERVHRVFASLLSSSAAGIGLFWVFLDEESLSWQDHISGTFLTADEAHRANAVNTAWAG